ncbi:Flavodoxin [Lachnospiraceae bacterium TWA4]|nr:Flavodoxin [Lachnospiraceae bacterium TWA4]
MTSATPTTNGGNTSDTEAAARMIQKETGADLYAIQVEQYYRTPYLATAATSWVERQFNIHPSLTALPESLDEYDTIYIGYPVWWFDAPMSVVSFLENYDLSGKTVVPFATSQDNDIDITMDTIREAAGDATVLEGMRIHNAKQSDVQNWLQEIGILQER